MWLSSTWVDRQRLGGCSAEVRSSHLLLKYSKITAGIGVLARTEAGGLCRQPASQKHPSSLLSVDFSELSWRSSSLLFAPSGT